MDHADAEKNDNFKAFAARASAECLLQFVRENLEVVGEAEDPILVRETSPLPAKFGPAALLERAARGRGLRRAGGAAG